ncbi:MAG: nickel pincer cofactor biosynthesis protein LarC [Deltaproteobacteria bacterium]|nr:nickel pincer cofactor biosynthesis protein LarC [Deltaproteobacteria bacterium]
MGRVLFIDLSNGISGDMFVAALVNMGIPRDVIECELPLLKLRGYKFVIKEETVAGIKGCSINIEVKKNDKTHRKFSEIKKLILDSHISDGAKRIAIDIFTRLANAESVVHSVKPDEVEFHEVGSIDSIVDIVASAVCINYLNCEEIIATTPILSTGSVKGRHGTIPLPAPSVVELLKGITVKFENRGYEMITPTGAAIITSIAKFTNDIPPLIIKARGYGFGTTRRKGYFPALIVYDAEYFSDAKLFTDIQVEATIDDMNPQIYSYLVERLFEVGASDVFITPVLMKKGRPAHNVTVIVEPKKMNDILGILFLESTTIGIRYNPINRVKLSREEQNIKTEFGIVRIKIARAGTDIINVQPEYEDAARIARETGIPLKEVLNRIITAYFSSGETTKC